MSALTIRNDLLAPVLAVLRKVATKDVPALASARLYAALQAITLASGPVEQAAVGALRRHGGTSVTDAEGRETIALEPDAPGYAAAQEELAALYADSVTVEIAPVRIEDLGAVPIRPAEIGLLIEVGIVVREAA